jgi:metallo-beta-lactamase class B
MLKNLLAVLSLAGCASAEEPSAQTDPHTVWAAENPDWIAPVAPFEIVDGVYFVGTEGLSVFLIKTNEGAILIDGGLPQVAPIVLQNLKTLGVDPKDVRILLNSHAHLDHSGGLAALKAATGAAFVASEGDRQTLETGRVLGSEDDDFQAFAPIPVDRVIADGESVTLGDISLKARIMPGHTRGCTSWSMNAEEKEILFFCSATVAGNRLAHREKGPQYPGIVEDFRRTFEIAKTIRPDIFLANHPGFFDMAKRRAAQLGGNENAFVDEEAFPLLMDKLEQDFDVQLAKQQSAAQ